MAAKYRIGRGTARRGGTEPSFCKAGSNAAARRIMAQKRRWNALLSDSKAFFTDWVGGVLLCIYYCPCCVAQLPPPQLYIYYQPPSCYKPSSARMEGQKPLNHPCFSTDSRKWKCKSRVVESAAHIHIHSTFFLHWTHLFGWPRRGNEVSIIPRRWRSCLC